MKPNLHFLRDQIENKAFTALFLCYPKQKFRSIFKFYFHQFFREAIVILSSVYYLRRNTHTYLPTYLPWKEHRRAVGSFFMMGGGG